MKQVGFDKRLDRMAGVDFSSFGNAPEQKQKCPQCGLGFFVSEQMVSRGPLCDVCVRETGRLPWSGQRRRREH